MFRKPIKEFSFNFKIMINVLYIHSSSVYYNYPNLGCWSEKEDARNFTGKGVIIAHPPCRLWSQMRAFSKADPTEKEYGLKAIDHVRKYGGIVENPVSSQLWKAKNIPLPGFRDEFGGFSVSVNQSWFGYYTRKNTLLYIVGIEPKELPPYPALNPVISRKFDNLSPKQRSETVPAFAEWLINIANLIEQKKTNCNVS